MTPNEIKTNWIGGPPYQERGPEKGEPPPPKKEKPVIPTQKLVLNDWPVNVEVKAGNTTLLVKVSAIGVTTVFRDGRRLMIMPLQGQDRE